MGMEKMNGLTGGRDEVELQTELRSCPEKNHEHSSREHEPNIELIQHFQTLSTAKPSAMQEMQERTEMEA